MKTRRREKIRYGKVGDGVRKERERGKDSKASTNGQSGT